MSGKLRAWADHIKTVYQRFCLWASVEIEIGKDGYSIVQRGEKVNELDFGTPDQAHRVARDVIKIHMQRYHGRTQHIYRASGGIVIVKKVNDFSYMVVVNHVSRLEFHITPHHMNAFNLANSAVFALTTQKWYADESERMKKSFRYYVGNGAYD